jgi:hypothetical protein
VARPRRPGVRVQSGAQESGSRGSRGLQEAQASWRPRNAGAARVRSDSLRRAGAGALAGGPVARLRWWRGGSAQERGERAPSHGRRASATVAARERESRSWSGMISAVQELAY